MALRFAGRPRPGARIRWRHHSEHAPCLDGAIAALHCRPWRSYDGGDHVLHLGEVLAAEQTEGEPLLFTGGHFSTAGLPLPDGPRVVPAWVAQARTLHDSALAV